MTAQLCFCFAAGDPCTPLTQRSGLGQDVRELLPLPDAKYPQQHGGETAALPEYDVHLDRGVILLAVVGEVSTSQCECLYLLVPLLVPHSASVCTS